MENNSLTHHGTKGMRWGIRRFQNKDGSLTPLGKKKRKNEEKLADEKAKNKDKLAATKAKNDLTIEKHKFKGKMAAEKFRLKAKVSEWKDKKKLKEEAEQKAEEQKKKEEIASKKDKILREGSVDDILSIKSSLSKQEMQQALERVQWEANMRNLKPQQTANGKTKTGEVFDKIGNATDYAIKGARAYNMIANVYNAFNSNGVELPRIDTDVKSGKKGKKPTSKEDAGDDNESTSKRDKKAEKAAKKAEKEANKTDNTAREEGNKATEEFYESGATIVDSVPRTRYQGNATRINYKPATDRGVTFVHDNPIMLEAPVSKYTSGSSKNTLSLGQRYVSGLLEAPKDRDD